jgi:dienelactone hydrolase
MRSVAGSSGGTAAAGSGAAGAPAPSTAGVGGAVAGASGAGDAGTSGAAGSPATTVMGCADSKLLALPDDFTARGPWPVGEKTVKIGRLTNVEVMYPAKPGSEQGKPVLKIDLRTFLPKGEETKVPDAEATIVDQQTYADLPLDDERGPYPVVIFVHGTASFRVGSFSTQALWASRGFVVVAADHPGLYLGDYLGSNCGMVAPSEDLSGDVDAEITALTTPAGDLAFLVSHIDIKRLALAGHSAGAYAVAQFSTKPGVQMVIPLSGTRAVAQSSTLKSVLYVSGIADTVLPYRPGGSGIGTILYPGNGTDAYTASPGPPAVKKRIAGITAGGHLVVTDLCQVGPNGMSDLDTAASHNVCGAASLTALGLADCGTIDHVKGTKIVNDVTTGALEETLHCLDRSAALSGLKTRYLDVGDFQEATK